MNGLTATIAGLRDSLRALGLTDERLIALLVFLAVTSLVVLILVSIRRLAGATALEQRLRRLEGSAHPGDRLSIVRGDLEAVGATSINSWLHDLSLLNRIRRYLAQARVAMGVAELLGLIVLSGLAVGAALWFGGWSDVRAVVCGLLATLTIPLWVMRRRARRMLLFSTQIPDALELMAGSLRAGHAYSAAVQVVAEELADPIATEFRAMSEEYRVGLSHRECLERLLVRVDHPDLHLFAVSVLIQTETGGNLAEVLEGLAETVRSRFKMEGKVRALTAEGRLSGVVLAILPVAMVVILSVVNPDYLKPLLTEKIGHIAMAVAILLQILGFLWIRKIVRVSQ